MKKLGIIPLALLLLLQSGCADGSIYSNYREIEQLRVIQTLGFDLEDNGDVSLSVSTGKPPEGELPLRVSVSAPSLSLAMESVQSYSDSSELYFPHTKYLMLGEAAASDALRFLDYVERSVPLRLDSPLFVVRGGEASEPLMEAGGEEGDITELLISLERDIRRRGSSYIFSCVEIAQSLAENGAALCCAVRSSEAEAATGSEFPVVLPAGFAVLRGGRLVDWIDEGAARGVCLLLEKPGSGAVSLPSGVTVELSGGNAELQPSWGADGSLESLNIALSLSAGILELKEPQDLGDEQSTAQPERELAALAEEWAGEVLAISKKNCADFLGLGRGLERHFTQKWFGIEDEWPQLLRKLPISVTAEAVILRSYDLSASANSEGGGK
ncbi:MAG: Ger(x)C family spore germination C-terminal domain-containing protein [Oscillospiraceae bacterium]